MNNNKISTVFENNWIKFNFLNGSLQVPDLPGGYVVASGCGSGKTTAIKQLISQKYREGILYSAATIEECNKMYEFCKDLVLSINNPMILGLDDIIVLHSNYKSEGTDINTWVNNPEDISKKRIVICTHNKLLKEDLRLLMKVRIPSFTTDDYYGSAMLPTVEGDGKLLYPRRYILIDELPTIQSTKYEITKSLLKIVARRVLDEIHDSNGNLISFNGAKFVKPESFSELKLYYDNIPDKLKFSFGTDPKNMKKEKLLSMIYRNFDRFMSSNDDRFIISDNISEMLVPGMTSTILLFDGTGDLTFTKDNFMNNHMRFNVVNLQGKRYNSRVFIEKFEFKTKRYLGRLKPGQLIENINSIIENVNKLEELILRNKKTLVITWKCFKDNDQSSENIPDESLLNLEDKDLLEVRASNINLCNYYKNKLLKKVHEDRFDVIYYQSGLDKATNQFKDYDSVIFLGEFHVPEYVISEFRNTYRTDTKSINYQAYQVIQAICRTHIRKHDGLNINVYFSEDWNDNLLRGLNEYFNGPSNMLNINSNLRIVDESLRFIRSGWKDSIDKLIEYDPELKLRLINGELYTINLTLSKIYEILPMSEKKVKKYYPLMRYLKKLGIELNIEVDKIYKNQYTSNK
jgi:hypothetical protein